MDLTSDAVMLPDSKHNSVDNLGINVFFLIPVRGVVHPLAPDRVVGCRCLFTVQLILFFCVHLGPEVLPVASASATGRSS